ALADLEARRIGAGFRVGDEERGMLQLEAALDIDARDLAVRVDADHYDAGRLLTLLPYTGPAEFHSGTIDGHLALRYPVDWQLVDVDAFLNFTNVDLDAAWLSEAPIEGLAFAIDVRSVVDI